MPAPIVPETPGAGALAAPAQPQSSTAAAIDAARQRLAGDEPLAPAGGAAPTSCPRAATWHSPAPVLSQLRTFAEQHRLRLRRDEDGRLIIPGRHGQLYDWEDGARLAVMVIGEHVTSRHWGNRRRACLMAGMDLIQDGDAEGTLRFDPTDRAAARTAIRAVGAYRRRQLSPETGQPAWRRYRARKGGSEAPEPPIAGLAGLPPPGRGWT
jgi:hypothetical protein